MSAPGRSSPDLRLGVRILAALGAGVGLYLVLVLVSDFFHHLNSLYWKGLDAGAVLLFAYVLAVLFGTAIRTYMRYLGNLGHVGAVRLLVNILISMGAVAVILSLFGVSLESLLVSSAFAGIVLGLAAQTVLANVLAGVILVVTTPFREGDRIGLISVNYGAMAPTYPHEMIYPTYTGVAKSVGLFYTDLRLDNGRLAKIPNQVMIGALIVNLSLPNPRSYRIRMTFDLKVPVARLERALAEYVRTHPALPGYPEPHVEVADLGTATWDGVVVLWSNERTEEPVRDEVMRTVLAGMTAPAA